MNIDWIRHVRTYDPCARVKMKEEEEEADIWLSASFSFLVLLFTGDEEREEGRIEIKEK